MSVTIEQIKELREATGVSTMACKKALEEAGGDYDAAVDLLRKKGAAKAADRADRATGNGVIVVKSTDSKAAMIELVCETDFVARGDDFIALANGLGEKLLANELGDNADEIPEVKDAVLKMGENIKVSNMKLVEGDVVGEYVHSNSKIGVIVELKGGSVELAKDIAMHAAATNPSVMSPDEVDQALVDKEKEIWTEQLKQEGKPEEIIGKIMMGKEKKFREESALLKQQFVKDPDKTIEQLVADAEASLVGFTRFAI
ncbi:translation elongation factor Ts [Candidatus Peregrinibacteria bacterium]|jgi:elongation factor Ts|nr:translation elongation factor Ts [Candidatus Peregrinibacteria bacterium]MBT7736577.1 translation elongation factor Ts [Candidatus Peregrinibacteria bacterium]